MTHTVSEAVHALMKRLKAQENMPPPPPVIGPFHPHELATILEGLNMTPHEHILHHVNNDQHVGYECLMCGAFAEDLAELLLIDCEPKS